MMKIPVADNSPTHRAGLSRLVEKMGYAVLQACDGSEAVELHEHERPHLVLIDLMMPEVSGFDVVDALQRNTDTARIPILVVTAKQITAQDRAARNSNPGKVIHT